MPPRRKPPTAPVPPSTSTAAATSDHDGQVQDPSSREHSTIASTSRRKPTRPTTATSMAGAGFFFDPALTDADNPDNVTCFECAKQLSHWDPQQDDPAAIHFQKSPQCAYARAICLPKVLYSWTTNVLDGSGGLLYDEADPSTYPKAEEMVNMRKKTFEGRWVHDRNPKFFANSTRLAKAGFVYDPDPADDAWTSLDDKATCVYCNLSLANWEPKDNPLTEHKKRNPACPFF
ncbi:inhibitor of apoptosis domain-domain-containing protein, partial [Catenaria anguillulae PL171]